MNLLKNLTLKKVKEKKDNYFDFYLNSEIKELKNLISELSTVRRQNQRDLREKINSSIMKELSEIEYKYNGFLRDLNNHKLKPIISSDNLEQIELMEEKKKSLRRDFESIYINFKRTAMSFEDIPMKMILKRMREVFDFNTQHMKIQQGFRYYDSTTMTIRYI